VRILICKEKKGENLMSINSGIKKQKKYIADENGNHTLTSLWTSTDTVEDSVGNTLTELLAQIGDPTVTVVASEESGIAKRYTIYQGGTAVSVPIDIPLDMVIQSGSLVDITFHDDKLWDGATDVTALIMPAGQTPTSANAGKYIKLVIANSSGDVIYISLLDLTFTDENVVQTNIGDYERVLLLLLAGSEDTQTKTEGASKVSTLKYNTKGSHLMVTDLPTTSTYIDVTPGDITLNGSGNTWDGTNRSLKTALSSAGTDANVSQSNSTYVGTTSHPLLLSSGTGSDVTAGTYVPNYIAYEEVPDTVSDTGYAYSVLTFVDDDGSNSIEITPYDIINTGYWDNNTTYHNLSDLTHDVADAFYIDPNNGNTFLGGLQTGYLTITGRTIEGGSLYVNIVPNTAEVSVGDKTTPSGSQVVHSYTSLQPSEIDVIRNYTDTQGNAYTKSLTIDATDIVLYGDGAIGNTWDGTNTSLKAAIANAGGTDENVKQSPTTNNYDYKVLLSGTPDNTEHTEGVKKTDYFTYNPSSKSLTIKEPNSASNSLQIFSNKITSYKNGKTFNLIADTNNARLEIADVNEQSPSSYTATSILNGMVDVISTTNGLHSLQITDEDIQFTGSNPPTWDGTNTSLKDTLAYSKTASGTIASFDDGASMPLKSLIVGIEPVQDLHGYDAPWVGGSGKNKCDNKDATTNSNGTVNLTTNGTYGDVVAGTTYAFSFDVLETNAQAVQVRLNNANNSITGGSYTAGTLVQGTRNTLVFTPSESGTINFWANTNAFTASKKVFDNVQLEVGNQATTYQPYANICPISGWDECNVTVCDDIDNPTVENEYTIQFTDGTNPLTVYKGELDVTNGILKVYPHYDSYNGETLNGEWISDRDAYSSGGTPTTGAEVQMISGDYSTYSLTPTAVASILGMNNVFADTGNVLACEYVPNNLIAKIEKDIIDNSGAQTNINYSTSEQDTGLKWIDGRPIYQKTYYLSTYSSTIDSSFTPDIYDNYWQTFVHWKYVTDGNHYVGSMFGGQGGCIYTESDSRGLLSANFTGVTPEDIYITIQYTKTADIVTP